MIYLAAPFSTATPPGMTREQSKRIRAEQITANAAHLAALGKVIYSPVTHGFALEPHMAPELRDSHSFWMDHCKAMLSLAKQLVVLKLPGWQESTGVQMELEHAARNGIPVFFMEPIESKVSA